MNANSPISELSLTDQAVAWLAERMPKGWEVEGTNQPPEEAGLPADSRISLRASNGTISTIVVEEKQVVSPRTVLDDLSRRVQSARNMGAHLPLLVVTPWLSRRAQALLADADIGYIDLTGNALVRIDNPPFYLRRPAPSATRGRRSAAAPSYAGRKRHG